MTTNKLIPSTHLITGDYLGPLPSILNTTQLEMMSILGLAANRWYEIINNKSDEALIPRHALLVRLLTNYPELSPVKQPPTPSDVYEEILSFRPDFSPNHFGFLLGMEVQSGIRLLDEPKTTRCNQVMLEIMMSCFQNSKTKAEKNRWLDLFLDNVLDEVKSRGINEDTFWKYGGWTKHADPKKKVPRKTRRHRL